MLLALNLEKKASIWEETEVTVIPVDEGHMYSSFSNISENSSTLNNSRYRAYEARCILPGTLLMWRTPSQECGCGWRRDVTPSHVNSTVIVLLSLSWLSRHEEPMISYKAYPCVSTNAVQILDVCCCMKELSGGKSSCFDMGSFLLVHITCLIKFWTEEGVLVSLLPNFVPASGTIAR